MSYGYNPQPLNPPKYDFEKSIVEKIESPDRVKNDLVDIKDPASHTQINKRVRKKVFNYLHTLKKRADMTNDLAKKRKLPYRLKIYVDQDRIFLDVSIIDADEKELNRISRDVTNNDFARLIDNISLGKGLIIDDLPRKE